MDAPKHGGAVALTGEALEAVGMAGAEGLARLTRGQDPRSNLSDEQAAPAISARRKHGSVATEADSSCAFQ